MKIWITASNKRLKGFVMQTTTALIVSIWVENLLSTMTFDEKRAESWILLLNITEWWCILFSSLESICTLFFSKYLYTQPIQRRRITSCKNKYNIANYESHSLCIAKYSDDIYKYFCNASCALWESVIIASPFNV